MLRGIIWASLNGSENNRSGGHNDRRYGFRHGHLAHGRNTRVGLAPLLLGRRNRSCNPSHYLGSLALALTVNSENS